MRCLLGVTTLLAVVWFGPLEYRDLFRPDEGRYAEIPREMVASGDWVTPRLNDLKYFEKPPLQYWATAAAYVALGEEEWTARLWPATLGFLGLLAVLITARKLFDQRTGVTAALILASTFIYVLFSQLITLDMGLTFFMTVSVFCFLLAMRSGLAKQHERRWMLGAWVAAALAVLSKGLIGIVLAALTLLVYLVIHRDWHLLRRMSWLSGIALFLTVAAPWFVLVQLRNPEFFDFFFLQEHFARFAQAGHHRPGAWYYFVPVVLAGAMPWSSVMLTAIPYAWRQQLAETHRINVDRFLLLWVIVIVGFFSLSSSKLPGYVLPVFPALALLAARWVVQAKSVQLRPHLILCGASGVAMLVGATMLGLLAKQTAYASESRSFAPWLALAGLVLIFTVFAARFQLTHQRRPRALIIVTLAGVITLRVVFIGAQEFAPVYSVEELVDAARAEVGAFDRNAPFYSLETYDQTSPLHLGRTVTLVNYSDEMAMGLRMEPHKGIPTLSEFRQRWRQDTHGYAVMPVRQYDNEQLAGTPMQVLARDSRYVFVQKPLTSGIPR